MIWPPSNAISSRTCSAMRDELREDAVDGVRMDEGDLEAVEALPRLLVDQLGPLVGKAGEGRAEVVDLVGHVVHAGATAGEELADGRVVAGRGEQLDATCADADRRGLDALVRDGLAVLELGPEEPRVGREGLVQIGDRDSEVVDPARRHRPMLSAGT